MFLGLVLFTGNTGCCFESLYALTVDGFVMYALKVSALLRLSAKMIIAVTMILMIIISQIGA